MRLLLAMLLLLPLSMRAATHTMPSLSQSQFNLTNALSSVSDGDTIVLPAGTATWTTTSTIIKRLTIRGAGTNNTIITGSVVDFLSVNVGAGANKEWRITEITFNLGSLIRSSGGEGNIKFNGGWGRIDRCLFTNGANNSIQIQFNNVIGVLDQCTFKMNGQQGIYQRDDSYLGVGCCGDWSWATNHSMGTTNQMTIERCNFISVNNQNPVYDNCGGARVTIRHCFFTNSYTRAHGTESTGRTRSVRQFEFYFNRQGMGDGSTPGNEIRGGTGVAFSNETSQSAIVFLKYFRQGQSYAPWGAYSSGWDCGTYPALDQPGRGKGDYMSGDNGATQPPTTPSSATCMNQQMETWYAWGNTNKVTETNVFIARNTFDPPLATAGRDYSNGVFTSYSPLIFPHPRVTIEDVGEINPTITSSAVANGTNGRAFSYQITADTTISTYAASNLPSGLSVSASTGLISGTPNVAAAGATNTCLVAATNSVGGTNKVVEFRILPVQPAVGLSTTTLTYSDTSTVGTADLTVVVTNVGGAGTLTGSATNPSSPWVLVGDAGYTLTGTATKTVTIRFDPSTVGVFSGTVGFTDPAGAVAGTVSLNGKAYPIITNGYYATNALVEAIFSGTVGGYVSQTSNTDPTPSDGGRLCYGFTAAGPGTLRLSMTMNATNFAQDSMYINVDAEPTHPSMIWDVPLATNFVSRVVGWRGGGTSSAPDFPTNTWTISEAGDHEIIVRGREDNCQIKQLSFEFTPATQGTISTTAPGKPARVKRGKSGAR